MKKRFSVILVFLIILLLQQIGLTIASDTADTATKVKQAVPFSETTFTEMKNKNEQSPSNAAQHRVIHRRLTPYLHKLNTGSSTSSKTGGAVLAPAAEAPALTGSFTGMSASNVAPPDTMGAAGPNYLVSMTNGGLAIYTKSSGALYSKVTLASFWSSLGTTVASDPYDVKVMYDQFNSRFIVSSVSGESGPNSYLLIGVSATSDPTGTWYMWSIKVSLNNGTTVTNNWGDYPQLGFDQNYVYVTLNMFDNTDNYQYVKVIAIAQSQLTSSHSTLTWTELVNPSGTYFALQPCHVFGTSQSHYFLEEGYYGSGNSISVIAATDAPVSESTDGNASSGITRYIKVYNLSFSGNTSVWTDKGYVQVQNTYPTLDMPSASQPGTNYTIDTGDTRMLSSVCRNSYIWASHTVGSSDNTKTEAAWYQIDPSKASSTVSSIGTTTSEGRVKDTTLSYFYPSIAVDSSNNVALGFSGSSSSTYGSAYYTARNSTDAAGTMQSVATLKAGAGTYICNFCGSTTSRWGDYSATVVDPSDESFWTLQEYAPGGTNTWGTWWGHFSMSSSSSGSLTHTLTAPTTTTVSRGGNLGPFSSSIVNTTSSTYYMYAYIYTPSGSWFVQNNGQTISAGQTLSATNLNMFVPFAAQTGTYYYFEVVYDSSWNTYEYKYFTYTVS
ncbi:hypothetical protein [Candidatus Magnetomonas plexicatena]|uniref:hypothetical protein n=1 Tax=Candidatus Magnetomonas plexicatena TaxID=2552947 RepID=UPI001C796534|nr:hypothetical protein E2O03_009170 [Nitrospirales bacterium LBB_01]